MFESIPAALKQRLKKKRVAGPSFLENSSEAISVSVVSPASNYSPVHDNLDNDFNGNDLIIKANMLRRSII